MHRACVTIGVTAILIWGAFCIVQGGEGSNQVLIVNTVNMKIVDYAKLGQYYASLNDWQSKRAFALELIDNEVISRGIPIREIAGIFGDDGHRITGEIDTKCTVSVLFEDQPLPTEDASNAIAFRGWYLRLFSGNTGTIENYYLSNLHK